MNSKEALKMLYKNCPMVVTRESDGVQLYSEYLIEVIKRDLDQLEQLEKENQELKEEKYKLKQEIDVMRENVKTFQNWNNSLFNTKEKLKKALEGLNECFDFEIDEETETIYCCLGDVTGIDIEFLRELKEVLGNE